MKTKEKNCSEVLKTDKPEEVKFKIIKEKLGGFYYDILKQFHIEKIKGYNYVDLQNKIDIQLLRCIRNYDFEKNVKFSTYFYNAAKYEIYRIYNKSIRKKKEMNKDLNFLNSQKERIYFYKKKKSDIDVLPNNRKKHLKLIEILIRECKDFLNKKEIHLLRKRAEGYKYKQIGFTRREINRLKGRFRLLKEKIKENLTLSEIIEEL